jgi:hypothetical protein
VDVPILADMDATNADQEIAVSLADGSIKIFTKTGRLLRTTVKKSFVELGADVRDYSQNSFFSGLSNIGSKIISSLGKNVSSIYSRLRIPIGSGMATPYIGSITARPVVTLSGSDVAETDFLFYVTDPQRQNIDSLTITINNSTTTPSNMRGRFRYTPTAGFVEVGGPVSFGNQFVTLLPQDAGNSPAGSQIIINQADSTVRYIFRWTVLSVYGVRPVNTITHQFVSGSYTSINTVAQTTFAVVQ